LCEDFVMIEEPHADLRVTFREITPALEFCAWVMVVLAPLLRLANGAPVTSDQAFLQYVVAGLSVGAAILLRLYNWSVPPVSRLPQDDFSTDKPIPEERVNQ
jgi:hypothetical protein